MLALRQRSTESFKIQYGETEHEDYWNPWEGKLNTDNMTTHIVYNPWNIQSDMAVLKDIPEKVNISRIENVETFDELDNPESGLFDRSISDENERNKELFEVMKYEENRLNSFTGKWPLRYLKPKDLAENGFFYLQSEDKVQCSFCGIIIDDWNVGEKPLKEHMKKSPRCPFLMTSKAGNVPLTKGRISRVTLNKLVQNNQARNSSAYKPKYPRMADMKNRLLSFKDWPLIMLSAKQLAECGLYYTGVADVVTCFFCGGSLGNWELNDDPWVEHKKFFPDCAYLDLVRLHGKPQTVKNNPVKTVNNPLKANTSTVSSGIGSVQKEILRQASEIFPNALVHKVAKEQFECIGRQLTSLHDLCEAILEYKVLNNNASVQSSTSAATGQWDTSSNISTKTSSSGERETSKDICRICMDAEPNVLFEPCHHLVSCLKCSLQIFNCPVCRTPITGKIKVYR